MANTLNDIPLSKVHLAQQVALVRLQLFVTGEVHRLVQDVYAAGEKVLREDTGESISPATAVRARNALLDAWRHFHNLYVELMGNAMREASFIPFGTLAVYHREWILPNLEEDTEDTEEARQGARGRRSHRLTEQRDTYDGLFTPQLDEIMQATQQRVEGDGLQLSGRIWRLDVEARRGIDRIVADAMANSLSAWDMAKKLEKFLGPNQDCPRWTRTRLFNMAKADIPTDPTGLLRGAACDGKGVAYNALRLARNEIQTIHHMATDKVFERMPWIEQEQVHLSPAHGITDICDDVVNGGEGGAGIYEKGEIALPLHPGCMCWKSAVLMEQGDFVDNLRGWMKGETSWAAMDEYAAMIGGDLNVDLGTSPIGVSLSSWTWDAPADLNVLLWRHIENL